MRLFWQSPKKRMYRLLYLLDNRVLEQGWIDAANDHSRVARIRSRLAKDGKSTFSLQSRLGELEITCTVNSSHGLITTLLSGKPLLSSVVLAESNPEAGTEIAQAFVSSLRRSKPVLEFAPAPETAFSGIVSAKERPFVGSVHWPIVQGDEFATLGALDADCAAAMLWRE